MRKIERELCTAIKRCESWSKDNTSYSVERDEMGKKVGRVLLFGNLIARVRYSANEYGPSSILEIVSGPDIRWFSRTTFSRINAITRELRGFTVLYTHKHQPMLSTFTGDREWETDDLWSCNIYV